MVPLSVIIVACNEADAIGDALLSVRWAQDIVVIDSGSTDGTQAICLELGARVIHREWDGFMNQKNFAIDQAQHDWVLNLDADERLDQQLQENIQAALMHEPKVQGYRIARKAFFLGQWIRHGGWYPDYRVRLWNRQYGRFGGYEPHADVKLDGKSKVKLLKGDLLHYPYRDIADNIDRYNQYSTIMAQVLQSQGRRARRVDLVLRPPWTFFRKYILQKGFLDGPAGLLIAGLSASSVFSKYAKLWELQHSAEVLDSADSQPPAA